MSRFDTLPADQKAVLQLVLKQGKSYEDIAAMLRMEADHVRERARDALDALGPEEAPGLTGERQDEIADYLLGQLSAGETADTHGFLEGSAGGRAWARVVSGELVGIAPGDLPEIPEEGSVAPEPEPEAEAGAEAADVDAEAEARPSSRLGGVIFLLGVGALLVVVGILVLGGGSDNKSSSISASSTPATTTATTATQVEAQINLRPAIQGSKALGVANLVSQGGQRAIALIGQSLTPSPRYAVWLFNSTSDSEFLGFAPPVLKNGRLQGLAPVPGDLAKFRELVITRETTDRPKQPGTIVLRGALK